MNLVKKRLSDNKYTMIGEFPSDAKMAQLLAVIRIVICGRLFVYPSCATVIGTLANSGIIRNATIETWPIREPHDYRLGVKYAVLRATEENWHLFGSNDDTGDLDIDGTIWDGDETVLSELVFAPFYEE